MANSKLTNAKNAKNDEFYTQYNDIEKEIGAYLDYDPNVFKGKVVYCNCDDPYESNFFRYFAGNFNALGLKKLITTSYVGSPITQTSLQFPDFDSDATPQKNRKPYKIEINEVKDLTKDGVINLDDVKQLLKHDKNVTTILKGDEQYRPGDFRSQECIQLLKQADIVATNPPFSLFREYVEQLVDHNKKFVIIGSMNAITYKEIFPLIKDNKMWLGNGFNAGNAYFSTPNANQYGGGVYMPETGLVKFRNVNWFTNIDHGRRHQPLTLMTMSENLKFNKKLKGKTQYDKYDNYDAIEVPFTVAIPSDYSGVMGVPISFLDKYNPDQFEIVGWSRHNAYNMDGGYWLGGKSDATIDGIEVYRRILIKHKKGSKS